MYLTGPTETDSLGHEKGAVRGGRKKKSEGGPPQGVYLVSVGPVQEDHEGRFKGVPRHTQKALWTMGGLTDPRRKKKRKTTERTNTRDKRGE